MVTFWVTCCIEPKTRRVHISPHHPCVRWHEENVFSGFYLSSAVRPRRVLYLVRYSAAHLSLMSPRGAWAWASLTIRKPPSFLHKSNSWIKNPIISAFCAAGLKKYVGLMLVSVLFRILTLAEVYRVTKCSVHICCYTTKMIIFGNIYFVINL